MNSEQEKELIDYLAGIGFAGQEFTDKLKEKIRLDTPNFTVGHTIPFGEEKMLFNLQFRRDRQFDAYRLDGYQATLRQGPPIEHAAINGIDTAKLEQRFKAVNWDQYFNDPKGRSTENERQEIKSLLSDLWQLTAEPSQKGKEIQDQLQYRYWPEHAWDDAARDLKQIYDWNRSFTVSEYGVCNTNLAYNLLSGKLDDLHEKLAPLGLEQYPGADIYGQLERTLSGRPDQFNLIIPRNEPEASVEYFIPIAFKDGYYSVHPYNVTVVPHPPIVHGTYNGIDSEKLEEQMKQIDWHNDKQLFIFSGDAEPEFPPKVNDVQEQIYRLSQDMVGAEIADRLMLKYWSDATFFSDNILESAWDLQTTFPKREHQFPIETDARSAFNLLCGRAVMTTPLSETRDESNEWMRLDLNRRNDQSRYSEKLITGFSKQDMEDQLGLLPINQSWYYGVRNSLLRGDLTSVPLRNGSRLLMEANPEQKTLNLYTPDMRLVPANLRLDPDWKPAINEEKNIRQTEQTRPIKANQYPTVKRSQKRKGRGL
ncbi:hypothetical protein [Mucilaginibacter sp. dw_454]|uniref:hypothetical protein n=1 Tax=Mucilaginibacter sp. dw_454 TaxID=2720079 RepID=UPI001BD58491|nr:hypothetical protein [Mucilaginibacter sp. dw_454]